MGKGKSRPAKFSLLGLFLFTAVSAILADRVVDAERLRRSTIARIIKNGGRIQVDPEAGFQLFESQNIVAVEISGRAKDPLSSYNLAQFKKLSKITISDTELQTDSGAVLYGQLVIGPISSDALSKYSGN